MNNEKQIDLVEEALKRAHVEKDVENDPNGAWQSSLMLAIKDEYRSEENETESLENSFLYYSWVTAAVAAALILVSGIIFSMNSDNIEDDIKELYSDNTLETITMEIASR